MKKSDFLLLIVINAAMAPVMGLVVNRGWSLLGLGMLLALMVFNAFYVRKRTKKSEEAVHSGYSRWPRALGLSLLILAPFHVLIDGIPIWLASLNVAFQLFVGATFLRVAQQTRKQRSG